MTLPTNKVSLFRQFQLAVNLSQPAAANPLQRAHIQSAAKILFQMVFYGLYLENQKLLLIPKRPRKSLAGNGNKEVGGFAVDDDEGGQVRAGDVDEEDGGKWQSMERIDRAGDDNNADVQGG